MTDLIERLRAKWRAAPVLGGGSLNGRCYISDDGMRLRNPDGPEAADEIAALRARVAELEAENDRLTKAVGSGILGELLNDEETDEFVNFIKFLRGQTKEAGCGKV